MRRDVEDLLDQFASPRGLRREVDRLFGEELSPRALMREMDRVFEEFESPPTLRRRMERLLEDFGGRMGMRRHGMFVPEIELKEKDGEYVMKVDLPGIRQEDVDVRIDDDNVLTVRGERREEETKHGRGYHYTERSYGTFTRCVSLPPGIDAHKIEADFHEGVLELHVPKSATQQQARRIPVGGGKEEPRVMPPSNGGREQREREAQAQR